MILILIISIIHDNVFTVNYYTIYVKFTWVKIEYRLRFEWDSNKTFQIVAAPSSISGLCILRTASGSFNILERKLS